jgi:hypothetical protein
MKFTSSNGKWVLASMAGMAFLAACMNPTDTKSTSDDALALRAEGEPGVPGSKGSKGKTSICHIPPGNPSNAHTISVGNAAVDAHLAHGDSLGRCEDKLPELSKKPCTAGKTRGKKGMGLKFHGKKVTICHIPPGNPANAHTISIGLPALKAHIAHGDVMGACTEPNPGASNCDDNGGGTDDGDGSDDGDDSTGGGSGPDSTGTGSDDGDDSTGGDTTGGGTGTDSTGTGTGTVDPS